MAYDAKVIEAMIASPGDVTPERQVVREVIADWNSMHSRENGVVLMAVGWETHSSPELSGRPQQMINDRLLKDADLLVAIFWTRIGSATGKAISGTVEEIDEHLSAGKPVMLYFSNKSLPPDEVDLSQREAVVALRDRVKDQGIFGTYSTDEELRRQFSRDLQIALNKNTYLRGLTGADVEFEAALKSPEPTVSADAIELLKAAVDDEEGDVFFIETFDGTHFQAGSRSFGDGGRREAARWKAALDELRHRGFLEDRGHKGEVFSVTHSGYQFGENLVAAG